MVPQDFETVLLEGFHAWSWTGCEGWLCAYVSTSIVRRCSIVDVGAECGHSRTSSHCAHSGHPHHVGSELVGHWHSHAAHASHAHRAHASHELLTHHRVHSSLVAAHHVCSELADWILRLILVSFRHFLHVLHYLIQLRYWVIWLLLGDRLLLRNLWLLKGRLEGLLLLNKLALWLLIN